MSDYFFIPSSRIGESLSFSDKYSFFLQQIWRIFRIFFSVDFGEHRLSSNLTILLYLPRKYFLLTNIFFTVFIGYFEDWSFLGCQDWVIYDSAVRSSEIYSKCMQNPRIKLHRKSIKKTSLKVFRHFPDYHKFFSYQTVFSATLRFIILAHHTKNENRRKKKSSHAAFFYDLVDGESSSWRCSMELWMRPFALWEHHSYIQQDCELRKSLCCWILDLHRMPYFILWTK